MSKTHTWFATKSDADLVISWLRDAGAAQSNGDPLPDDWLPNGRQITVHFPLIGPIELWPATIRLSDYEENSSRWRLAVLTKMSQDKNCAAPLIDPDRSPVANFILPELRDDRYWVAAELDFLPAKLKEAFPELNRICQRFDRFLRKHPVVFDNTKGYDTIGFGDQLCTAGIVHRVHALPEAYSLLRDRKFMIDRLVSPKNYADFRWRMRYEGHET